jgi:hypothetical protein
MPSHLSLFQNSSTPGYFSASSLAARVDFPCGTDACGVSIGDLHGDGRPDIALANNSDATLSLYRNLIPFGGPPGLVSQPVSQTVYAGQAATFTASATGTLPLSYQWRFMDDAIFGQTGSTLTLPKVTADQAGNYSVVITNPLGSVTSSNAVLTVLPIPDCAPPPSGLVGWWRGEGNLADSVYGNNGSMISGPAFRPGAVKSWGGQGHVGRVYYGGGESLRTQGFESPAAGLWPPPGYSGSGSPFEGPTFVPGEVGEAFDFDGVKTAVTVPASANLAVQSLTVEGWIYPTDLSMPRPIVEYGTTGQASPLHLWMNVIGVATAPGALYADIRGAVLIHVSSPAGAIPANQWSHVALTYDDSTHAAVLYCNGVNVGGSSALVPLNLQTLIPVNIGYRRADSGDVWAGRRFAGRLDEISIYNRALSVAEIQAIYHAGVAGKCRTLPPAIGTQPVSMKAYKGQTVTLTVAAGGEQPLSYQWRMNGAPLAGRTGSELVLTDVQAAQAGKYSVVIANAFGSVTSSNAVLAVQPLPDWAQPSASLISWWRGEGDATDSADSNHGTLVNGVTFAPGKVGQAFSFNGIDQYVSVPDSPSLRPASVTLACWANFGTVTGIRALVMKPYGSGTLDSCAIWYDTGVLKGCISTASGYGELRLGARSRLLAPHRLHV